MSRAVNSAS
jgi:hypothetical protein